MTVPFGLDSGSPAPTRLLRRASRDSMSAIRDLDALQPEVADSARSLIAAAAAVGIKLTPIETRRSQARQDSLYQQGRGGNAGPVVTWTHRSNHTLGAAVDFMVNDDLSGNDPGYRWLQENAPTHGFGVLGAKDPGHVEMSRFNEAAPPSDSTSAPEAPVGSAPEQDPVLEKAKQLRKAGASIEQVKQYLQSKGYEVGQPAAPAAPATPSPEVDMPEPGYGERLATHVLNTAQGIPGMEAVEAFAGKLGSHLPGNQPMTYQESLDALRANTSEIGGKTRATERMLGSVATLPFLPANPAAAGALLGGADQALSADPIHSKDDLVMRAGKTALGAGAGALVGKTLDAAVTGVRGLKAETPGAVSLEEKARRLGTDSRNYGKAANEAAASYGAGYGSPPTVAAAFAKPDIAPFVEIVKGERQFANADDGTILREVFKRMTREQGGLSRRLKEQGYDAAMQGKLNNIQAAKEELLTAADQFMPSFRGAVGEHAGMMGEKNALETGVDASRRLMRNAKTPPKKLENKSPEAIRQLIASMPPEQQGMAEKGILGELGTSASFGMEPSATTVFGLTKGFGVGPYVADAARVAPLLRTTNTKAQQAINALIKAGLLSAHATSR